MSVAEAYNEWAKSYDTDQNLTRDLDAEVTRKRLAEGEYQSILELGCGTGKNTPFLAQLGRSLCALDFSPAMIAKAQAKMRAPNVSFALANFTRPWPCAAHTFDLISCNLVLEHIEDLNFIFSEAARTLASSGRFFICELHPFKQYGGTKARFQRENGRVEIDAFVHHLSDYWTAAEHHGFTLKRFDEWWHSQDMQKPPRLVSFLFER